MKYLLITVLLSSLPLQAQQTLNFGQDQDDALVKALRDQATMNQPRPQNKPVKVQLVDQYGFPVEFER